MKPWVEMKSVRMRRLPRSNYLTQNSLFFLSRDTTCVHIHQWKKKGARIFSKVRFNSWTFHLLAMCHFRNQLPPLENKNNASSFLTGFFWISKEVLLSFWLVHHDQQVQDEISLPEGLDLFWCTPLPTISYFAFWTHLFRTFEALVKSYGLPYLSLLTNSKPSPSVDLLCLSTSTPTQTQMLSQPCKRLFFLTSSLILSFFILFSLSFFISLFCFHFINFSFQSHI